MGDIRRSVTFLVGKLKQIQLRATKDTPSLSYFLEVVKLLLVPYQKKTISSLC